MTTNPDCKHITLMWGAQTGKTQVVNCALAYNIAQTPSSQIMAQPSQGDLQTWLETKFTPMVDANSLLEERLAKPRGREGVNNQRIKSYPGGFLMFAWSGSPKTMRGRSAPKIYCDEVDGYEVTAEGHPVSLLWQRAATFGDARTLMETSTPTIKGASQIESSYESGDMRRFWLPCVHCGEFQTLKWAQVAWDRDPETKEHLPETAYYTCEHCAGVITDGHKISMLRYGEWRAEKPFRGHASYHLSELYSKFRGWRDIVQSFLEKRAQQDLQTFINVSLAETWEEDGETVDSTGLLERREEYEEVPEGALVLTAGIDVQGDRLEMEVVAWGEGEESWNVDYRVIPGDPARGDVWDGLDDALSQTYAGENGNELHIAAACIDSGGHHTQIVYDYARRNAQKRVFAIKGVGGAGRPIFSISRKGGSRKVDLYTLGVDDAKTLHYARLKIENDGPGYCHFPMTRNDEYFAQLTAEKVVTKHRKGFAHKEWVKYRPRNEALDCRVYAIAALKILNPVWSAIERRNQPETKEKPKQPTPTEQFEQQRRTKHQRKRRKGFVNTWR